MQVGRYLLEPAVEPRDGDVFREVVAELRAGAQLALGFAPAIADLQHAADLVADRMLQRWDDRAFYVEAWEDGEEGYAQVVQPWGFPRNADGVMR